MIDIHMSFFNRALRFAFCLILIVAFERSVAAQEATPTPVAPATPAPATEAKSSFISQVAPIIQDNCVSCHSAKKAEGGYRLDTFHELMQPGDSATATVVAKQADMSLLLQRIVSADPSERMPPDSPPLSAEKVEAIRAWINSGADFDGKDPKQLLGLVTPPAKYPAPPATYPAVPVTAICFNLDGTQVILGGYHELTVWDANTGQLLRRIPNIGQRSFAIAISPDGKTLAVACGEPGRSGEVRMVDLATGEVTSVVARSIDVILDVAFRPGRDEIGVAAADNSVRIINYRSGELVRGYSSHADWVTALAFSADGNKLVSASRDKSAKVFDLESGQMLINYAGHGLPVRGVAFSADGAQVVSVGDDKKLHRWNIADAKKIAEVGLDGEAFHIARVDNSVYVPSASRRVLKIDLASNKVAAAFAGHDDWVLSVAVATDGRIASGSTNGIAKVFMPDGKEVSGWIASPK